MNDSATETEASVRAETPKSGTKAVRARSDDDADSRESPRPAQMPFDVRTLGIVIIAGASVLMLLRYMQQVIIPFVLSTLIFYALAPIVNRLQRWRVPRALGAALVLASLVGGIAFTVYQLRDETLAVVEELPAAARKFRGAFRPTAGTESSALEKVRRAADELDKTAAESAGSAPAPQGVAKVQVVEPGVRVTDFVRWGSVGMLTLASQGVMILSLSYFLLVANDLFKRKIVRHFGDTAANKKITLQILDKVGTQVERFLLVQAVTSIIVAVVTGLALWLLDVHRPAVWGVAAGVFNIVPYFGPMIVTAGLSIIAFMQFGTLSTTATVAGVALLITTLEGWLLTPTLLGRAAQMNHVAVFAGLLFWSWVWGIWGVLLAVPMMMVIKSVCDHVEGLQPIADFLGE